jgi:hypothetical protein
MRVWIYVSDPSHTVTLPTSVSIAVGDIAGYNSSTDTITFDAAGNYVFDFSSVDGGNTYLIFDVTRNRSTFRDPNLYFNNAVTPTLLVGYGAGQQTALSLEVGQDRVSSLGSYNSVAVGNIQLANVAYTQFDTGGIAGYSVTAARGDLLSVNDIAPVHGGDLLGYLNGIGYTGTNNTGNVFQQLSSIDFFATGSNVAYGLGGNIAFFTADDGGNGINVERQAMGIENDQSVHVYGNFYTAGGIVNGGTYLQIFTSSGPNNFTANNAVSTVIIDSSGEITVPLGNIVLPTAPVDRQTMTISCIPVMTSANIYGSTNAVKFAPSGLFSSGNTVTKFTYIASSATWYRS